MTSPTAGGTTPPASLPFERIELEESEPDDDEQTGHPL